MTSTSKRALLRRVLPIVGLAALVMPASALAAARAELRPAGDLVVDTPAQLVVTADTENAQTPQVHVPGATVRYYGEMENVTVTNGRAKRETSFLYSVVPHAPGALAIPAIRVGGDRTAPIEATVVAASAQARSGVPRNTGAASAADREPTRAFIRLEVPKRTLYVGEAVPVRIRAYFRGGIAAVLRGAPRVSSSAFTLSQLSKEPVQQEVELQGVPYLQATWTAVISPAKPTTEKSTIELPVEIAYRERRAVQRRSMRDLFAGSPFGSDPFGGMDSMFDDPFFDDAFADVDAMFDVGPVRQQELTLRDTVGRTRIAELPDAGKPADFGGAVGAFELAVTPPAEELRVGEPVTLTFAVTGAGNFDRVQLKGIPASEDWKVYSGKTDIELDKAGGIAGTKTFTQTIVPTRDGSIEVPAVSLSYFDPKAGTYRTAQTQPFTLAVAPAPAGGAADPGLATSSVRDSAMTPNRSERGVTAATLVPLIQQDAFWRLPAALAALTSVLLLAAFNRRSEWARQRRHAHHVARDVARQRKRLERAAREGDAITFFDAARSALQIRLGAAWDVAPESITAGDVADRLGERGKAIYEVFEQADQMTYAPGVSTPHALDRWRALVTEQLAKEV